MKKFTSQEIKEFVAKPLFDEKVILSGARSTISRLHNFCGAGVVN